MVRVSIPTTALFRAIAALFLVQVTGGCASSSRDADRAEDPNRSLADAAIPILPPKTEISFPPLPLKRKAHAIHRGSPIAGYELIFTDRSGKERGDERPANESSCRLSCIGGDCAINSASEEQMFLVQGKFVVSYSRMFGRGNRLIAFLASLKRSFAAPVIYLDCLLPRTGSGKVTVDDLLAELPADTQIDSQKNAGLSLTESLPDALPVYELATNRCLRKVGNPYASAALFVLTSKGIQSYSPSGALLPLKVGCGTRVKVSRCIKIADYLLSNGVSGCLF
jgi:hypothetical protein